MADWYELSDLIVEMAFGYSPTETPVWLDQTEYVREIPSIRRGRQSEFSAYSPGTATIVLSNRNRRYDPSFSAGAFSPLYGLLEPMVPVRITADSYPVFYGFVQGWPQAIGKGYTDSTVTINCVDAFRILNQRQLAESAYRVEVLADSPMAYWPLQSTPIYEDAVGQETMTPFGDPVETVSDGAVVAAVNGIACSYDAAATNNVSLGLPTMADEPRTIEAWVYPSHVGSDFALAAYKTGAGATTSIGFQVFGGVNTYNIAGSSVTLNKSVSGTNSSELPRVGEWSHVVVTLTTTVVSLYVNGELVDTVTTGTGTSSIGVVSQLESSSADAKDAIAHIAVYDTALSAARVAAHYNAGRFAFGGDFIERTGARVERVLDEIGWPTGARDISDGQSELGGYRPGSSSALSYLRQMEQVEQGSLFVARDGDIAFRDRNWHITAESQVTFADEYSTGLDFRDIYPDANTVDAIVNVASVTWAGGTITDMDQTSVDAYEASSTSVSSQAIKTLFDARDLARWLIRLGKDPRTRITRLTVTPRADPSVLFNAILGLELGEVITVKITPLGIGLASEYLLAVQGIQHRITRNEWVTDLYLAPSVAGSGPYWTIGDATLGKVGAAFGNKVHY